MDGWMDGWMFGVRIGWINDIVLFCTILKGRGKGTV